MARRPAELLTGARPVKDRHGERHVDPADRCRLKVEAPRHRGEAASEARAERNGTRPEGTAELLGVEDGVRRDVERTANVFHEREAVRIADVEGVDDLEAQARDVGYERQKRGPKKRVQEEGTGEEPPDPRRGLPLEDERRAQTDDSRPRMLTLEPVEPSLDLGLVASVEARADPARGPALVNGAVLRPGRVGADRGRIDERRNVRLRDGAEEARAAVDVDTPQVAEVARRLDHPGQVDDGVGAAEERDEVRLSDIRLGPFGLLELELGATTRDAKDGVERRIARKRAEEARVDVTLRAEEDEQQGDVIT